MSKNNQERYDSYIIPDNFAMSGMIMGKIPIRNAIDTLLFGGLMCFLNYQLIKGEFTVRLIVGVLTILPVVIFSIIGIDGGSLTEYAVRAITYLLDRRNLKDEEGVDKELKKIEEKNNKNVKEETSDNNKKSENKTEYKVDTNITTASVIPIEKIFNGVVKTTTDEYIKILEIIPGPFNFLKANEQNNIIEYFAQTLKVSPISVQFKCLSLPSNSGKYIKNMEKLKKLDENKCCSEFIDDYNAMIKKIGDYQGVSRRFFFIFKYRGLNEVITRDATEEDIAYELSVAANTIASSLKNCGCVVTDFNDRDEELEQIFYEMFNRALSQFLPLNYKKQYADIYFENQQRNELLEAKKSPNFNPETFTSQYVKPELADYLSPSNMDFSNPNYCKCDGVYYKFLYIDNKGYNNNVYGAWLNAIVNAGNGIDIDIFAKKEDSEKIRDKIQSRIVMNRSQFKFSKESDKDVNDLQNSIVSGEYILNAMSNESEEFYYFNTIITISAYSLEDCIQKTNLIKNFFKARDIILKEPKFWQEKAFFSVLPLCSCDEDIFKKSKRNVLTHGLASTYIYTSSEISDEDGVLFGINKTNDTLAFVNNFNLKKYTSPNMFIIGTTGAGKTYTMQQIALRYRYQGIQTFILAPLKGHEFRRSALALGGEFISVSTANNDCINIMEIRDYDSNSLDRELEEEYGLQDSSKLSSKIQQITTFISLIIPSIKEEEKQIVDDCIIKTYERFGITADNNSLYNSDGTLKKMPVLGDLKDELDKTKGGERISLLLNKFVTGSAKVFNQQTNVDLNNKMIVFDLSTLSKELLPIGMFVVLDYIWDSIKADRTKKKILFIDEVWKLIGATANTYAAEFVLEIFKIIRGYGGAAVTATQDFNDFFTLNDGAFGRGIINQCNNKIILKLEEREAQIVKDMLDLTETDINEITRYDRGDALLVTGNSHLSIKLQATPTEHYHITTDREELSKLAHARAEKKKTETKNKAMENINNNFKIIPEVKEEISNKSKIEKTNNLEKVNEKSQQEDILDKNNEVITSTNSDDVKPKNISQTEVKQEKTDTSVKATKPKTKKKKQEDNSNLYAKDNEKLLELIDFE